MCSLAWLLHFYALILGSGWAGVIPTVVVLSVSLPWRMIAGQAGSLAVAVGKVRDLVRWELSRLVVFGVAYVAAALVGYGAFVVTVSVVWIIGITTLQDAAERAAALDQPASVAAVGGRRICRGSARRVRAGAGRSDVTGMSMPTGTRIASGIRREQVGQGH